METDLEVKKVISELRSGHGSSLYGALIMIRTTLIKSKNSLTHLVQMGAIQLLIQLLEERRRHKNQINAIDIIMSILANLCLEEDVREQVVRCDGLSVIARVTLSAEQESIQNRGVRALANLALDVSNCEKIFAMEVPAFVAKRLMESEDAECRSTYCRALQLFGQTGKDAKRLMEETQAIQALAALLKLDNRKLALKSLRILSELSALRCCPSFTGQILAANILEELVNLADDEDNTSASYSLSIILRLCEQEIMRPALGSAGIISLLVKLVRIEKNSANKVLALNALCLCTKEAVNRTKIQEAGGLELFISALNINGPGVFSEGQFSVLYDRIISSLVNFLYNDECLGKLLELGLVRILLEHLKRACAFTSVADDLRKEIDSFAASFEAYSSGRDRHLDKSSKTNTVGTIDSDALDNSCPSSLAEFPSTSVQHEQMRDDPERDCLEYPSNTSILQDKADTIRQGVPDGHLNNDDEKRGCVVENNSDEMIEDGDELLNSPENLEMPSQHSSEARHTFSINSPTYQMETDWRLEDYTSGVTCKSFNHYPEPYSMSQHGSSSPYPINTDLVQAPYSPLSAGASYYSPSQSSTSPSVLLSPVQSTIPCSPTSGSYQGSPTWAYSSPEHESIPASAARLFSPHSTGSLSPPSLAYQNQFSPLNNAFPASPLHLFGERYSQSPTPSSQNSLLSQSSLCPYLDKNMPNMEKPEHVDQLLAGPGASSETLVTGVPLSLDTMTTENMYSASEDDDDGDDSVCGDGDDELNPSVIIAGKFANKIVELYQNTTVAACSSNENINSPVIPTSRSVGLISNKRGKSENATFSTGNSAGEHNDEQSGNTSKRVRLSQELLTQESVGGHNSAGHSSEYISRAADNSNGSMLNACLSDDEEIQNASQDLAVINSATAEKCEFNDSLPLTAGAGGETEIQVPSSPCSTLGFENINQRSFQRMASYLGKEKRLTKASRFRKHPSGTHSSMSKMIGSTMVSVLPVNDISDSPYRSPYSEPAHNDTVGSPIMKINSMTNTTKRVLRSNSEDLFVSASSPFAGNSPKTSDIEGSGREASSSSKIFTAAKSDQSIDDVRVKKIHRTTEANILILLARVSVKTNPTQLLTESTVTHCLLGYIASAPNPIRRSCRILYRLCSNPHCFEKLILMQMPALIVKALILETDGMFPHNLFCSDNRSMVDFLPSSQESECSGSQRSEFGRKIDFEFADDAYSKMTSKKHSSLRSIFQNRHILIVDGETARGDDIYEAGSSRVETCVRIGLELLYTLGAVAMSKFGQGEIQHLLMRHSAQDKLACVISMLHLQVGWCHMTRDKFFTKYSLWDKILPCLFTSEAPLVRETIVAALSLHVHLDNPAKLTQLVSKLPVCPNLQISTGGKCKDVNDKSRADSKAFMKNAERTKIHTGSVVSSNVKTISDELLADRLQAHEQADSRFVDNDDQIAGCSSDTTTFCPYQKMSEKYDVCFFIIDEDKCHHKIHARRKTLVEKSEVFAAMFSGSYAESVQSEINVPDVSKDAFEFIIHYLHGCSSDCSVIASLSMGYIKNEIVTAELGLNPGSTELSSEAEQHEQMCDEEKKNVEEGNSADKKESPCGVNDSTKSELNVGRKHPEEASGERCARTDTSRNISQLLEFTQSQDSLDSLTLEDRTNSKETSHACRKLSFKNPFMADGNEDTEGLMESQHPGKLTELTHKCLEELIHRCDNILALADRFLLHDLMHYPASVLAHVCLCDHTVEEIFHLACFYHLDRLAFDCIRETIMSCLPCSDAAAIYVQLADDGFREQVHTALNWLVNHMKAD
ncbi:hypothetical protein BsWGS_21389 [Bradybaena similaris]